MENAIDARPDALLLGENEITEPMEFQTVDPKSFPFLSATDRIINTYENIEHLLNFYRVSPRFNELRKEIEAVIPHKNFTKANEAKLLLAEVISLCNKNGVPRIDVPSWLMMIADKNSYNPVWDYLTSQPWDGVCRKKEFFNTIEVDNIAHRDFILERWMRGAVASGISKKGLAHHGVLTILGKQGCGKSSWIKKLTPLHLKLVLPDFTFNPHDKDLVITATKYWITELSEVASTHRKADVDALKSFISRDLDTYRCPYDRADTEAPRKTAFVATVNDNEFLKDDTGNRRWWVIEAKSLNYLHDLDMQQVWAQFHDEVKKGGIYHLTSDEIQQMNKTNEQYLPTSSIFEMISERYLWDEPEKRFYATATQVLYDCGIETKGNNSLTKEANKALKKLTGEDPKISRGVYKYRLPVWNSKYRNVV